MFKVGQRVRHKTRGVDGCVLEWDDGTVYLETDTGVEMAFPAIDLEDATPIVKPPGEIAREQASRARDAEFLSRLPESVVGLAQVAFARDAASARNGWEALPDREKLTRVAAIAGLPLDQLKTLADAGKGRQIEAHAAVARGKANAARRA